MNRTYNFPQLLKITAVFFFIYSFFVFPAAAASLRRLPGAERFTYLDALSFDKRQTARIASDYLSEDGAFGIVEIDGWAEGHNDNSLNGIISIWLSMGPREKKSRLNLENPLPGWNVMIALKPGQSPEQTAKAIALYINSDLERPYYAEAYCHKVFIYYRSFIQARNIKKSISRSKYFMNKKFPAVLAVSFPRGMKTGKTAAKKMSADFITVHRNMNVNKFVSVRKNY